MGNSAYADDLKAPHASLRGKNVLTALQTEDEKKTVRRTISADEESPDEGRNSPGAI